MTTQSSAFKSQSLNFVVETSVHLATALPTASSVLPPPEVWGDRVNPLVTWPYRQWFYYQLWVSYPPTMGLPWFTGKVIKSYVFSSRKIHKSPWAAFASTNLDPSCTMFRAVEVFKEMCRRSMSLVVTNRPISCQIPIEFRKECDCEIWKT